MAAYLNKLQSLSIHERFLLLISALLLPAIGLMLHLFGFKQTKKILGICIYPGNKSSMPIEEQLNTGRQIARVVTIAANHGFYSANCLKKSLLISWLLRWKGIITELKIAATRDGIYMRGHAWIVLDGYALTSSCDYDNTPSLNFSVFL